MGYDIHITRKENWFDVKGDDISLDEWKAYIYKDHEMRLDGYAAASTPDGLLRVDSEGLAVWIAHSEHGIDNDISWISYGKGNVKVKNPDQEILIKMHKIATSLRAKVQGDEGEIYDVNGDSNWLELRAEVSKARNSVQKKWWHLWK